MYRVSPILNPTLALVARNDVMSIPSPIASANVVTGNPPKDR